MNTLQKYTKLANLLDELGKYKEAEQVDKLLNKLAGYGCNCENEACEKLNMHRPGHCDNPAGQFKALYIGHVCDECADNLPSEYLITFKNHPIPDRIGSLSKEAGSANDYLDAALRDMQELMRYLPEQRSYELNNAVKELDYHLKMVKNELVMSKSSSLELEMEKEVVVEENDDKDEDEEKETKKKKITLSFD